MAEADLEMGAHSCPSGGPAKINKSLSDAIARLAKATEELRTNTDMSEQGDLLLDEEFHALEAVVAAPANNVDELMEKLKVCFQFEVDRFGLEPDASEKFGTVAVTLGKFLEGRN